MSRLVVLTYDAPHRKTQDVLVRLWFSGLTESVALVATPWESRKRHRPVYPHRPAEPHWPCEAIAGTLPDGVAYTVAEKEQLVQAIEEHSPEMVLVGGAGILAPEVVDRFPVLNVHPGFLPACRGLDALKWAVIESRRVGVTAHLCDSRPDLGWRVLEREVPVYPSDTFHAFAMRQYEMELDLIVEAVGTVWGRDRESFERVEPRDSVVRRRMPRRVEADLMGAFERYKVVYG